MPRQRSRDGARRRRRQEPASLETIPGQASRADDARGSPLRRLLGSIPASIPLGASHRQTPPGKPRSPSPRGTRPPHNAPSSGAVRKDSKDPLVIRIVSRMSCAQGKSLTRRGRCRTQNTPTSRPEGRLDRLESTKGNILSRYRLDRLPLVRLPVSSEPP